MVSRQLYYPHGRFLAYRNCFDGNIQSLTISSHPPLAYEEAEDGHHEYNVETALADQIVIFKPAQDVFVGGEIIYKDIRYDPNNQEGEDFLIDNGIVDKKSLRFGVVASYDTRKNKYYPSNAVWASQIFGKYSTDKTPDAGLPTLSGKSLLRGFPAGNLRLVILRAHKASIATA